MSAAARLASWLPVAFAVLLASLHFTESELNGSGHLISEYELGHLGWMMQLAFFCLGGACISLSLALRGAVRATGARIGRWWLVALGGAFAGAGIWVPDAVRGMDRPANVAPTLSGILHGISGLVVIVTSPIAFTLLRRGRWPTRMAWIGLASFAASLITFGVTRQRTGAVEPMATLVSVCNRFMILTYAAWLALAARQELHGADRPVA